ncbi:MAG: MFS transporter [Blastocatellia bacterium]|nr:MFS transporter [Blastocatellia bacterium]
METEIAEISAIDKIDKPSAFTSILQKIVNVTQEEIKPLLLACGYFFFLLSSYFILRPIRDEIGAANGIGNLPWLFTGTLVATLVASPIFSSLVTKFPVKKFITYTYLFFTTNIVIFYLLFSVLPEKKAFWVGCVFFVWISVFNLFVVSIFWAFMADIFSFSQGKRLFGFIAGGGTLGSLFGSLLTAFLATRINTVNLFLISLLLLLLGLFCVQIFPTNFQKTSDLEEDSSKSEDDPKFTKQPIGGHVLAGISHTAKSTYLLGICCYILLFTIGSTFLYFQQTHIVATEFQSRGDRQAFLAKLDLLVNSLTVLAQFFFTGRFIQRFGIGLALILVPTLSVLGFTGLALMPMVPIFAGFQVMRRSSNYAISGTVREVLFTVVQREDKYKAKNFIDTFIYRTGDQVGAWSNALLAWVGLGLTGIAWVGVPISILWLMLGLWLGWKQSQLAKNLAKSNI